MDKFFKGIPIEDLTKLDIKEGDVVTEATAAGGGGAEEPIEVKQADFDMDNDLRGRRRPELQRFFAFMDEAGRRRTAAVAVEAKEPVKAAAEARAEEPAKAKAEPVEAKAEPVEAEPEAKESAKAEAKAEAKVEPRPAKEMPKPRPLGIEFKHPDLVVPPNRRSFLDWVEETYAPFRMGPIVPDPDACFKRGGSFRAFPQQQVQREMLQKHSHLRGLLFYVGLGAGKTCMSILVAEANLPERRVIVLLPASLHDNQESQLMECGNPLQELDAHWEKYIPESGETAADAEDEFATLEEFYGFPNGYLRKQGHLWVNTGDAKSNLNSLSAKDLTEIREQTRTLIRNSQEFMHQNGLREKSLKERIAAEGNPFHGKTIIIDEAHNLARMITGDSKIGRMLQELLLEAEDCRIVALSGTPIINQPQEVGILINIITGYTKQYKWAVPGGIPSAVGEKINALLESHQSVDTQNVDASDKAIYVTRVPSGFVRSDDTQTYSDKNGDNDGKWADSIKRELAKVDGLKLGRRSLNRLKRLPDKFDDFMDKFLTRDLELRNPFQFRRRLMGAIGYQNAIDPSILPRLANANDIIVRLPMSDKQVMAYEKVRADERGQEKRGKKAEKRKAVAAIKEEIMDVASSQRVFSRQSCNFVFPDGVTREYPQDLRKEVRLNERRVGEEEEVAAGGAGGEGEIEEAADEGAGDDTYEEAVRRMLAGLRRAGNDGLLAMERLRELSPKYATILERIAETPGLAVVQSQFVSLEGITAFAECARANGYAEFRIRRRAEDGGYEEDIPSDPESRDAQIRAPKFVRFTGEVPKEERKILIKLFRGELTKVPEGIRDGLQARGIEGNKHGEVAKVILISASGAEGLDLKQIRQIHICEPQWNNVRTDQVIGRGVRVCSHAELPEEEREVHAYIQVMEFTEKQLEENMTFVAQDGSQTTDQYILGIAEKKKRMTNSIQQAMRDAAIDCRLHRERHQGVACLKFPPGAHGKRGLAWVADINKDLRDEDVQDVRREEEEVRGTFLELKGGVKAFMPVGTNELQDAEAFQRGERLLLGRMQQRQGRRVLVRTKA